MNDDDKKQADIQSSGMAEKASLSDQELKDVVGGGFTFIDLCQNRWVKSICREAWYGFCPHLSMQRGQKIIDGHGVLYDLLSCDKGCFKDVKYMGPGR